jgi:hypothetical protein
MDALEELERLVEPVVLLGGWRSQQDYTYAHAKADWLDRRLGGDGFWSAATHIPQGSEPRPAQ